MAVHRKPQSTSRVSQPKRTLFYHLYSIWLFTLSDLKTIVVPQTIFGLLNAAASSIYDIHPKGRMNAKSVIMGAFWVWINLLPFVIDNQRRRESILEDEKNKPWRTMPSKRMTERQAYKLMIVFYVIAFFTSSLIGGRRQAGILLALGYWYNSLGGAKGAFTKNFINACGFLCFASGSMEVILGFPLPLSPSLLAWLYIISLVIFTTIQTQDLPDQAGDAVCQRKTLPLALGDFPTRLLTALFMSIWSIYCPSYWQAPPLLSSIFAGLGFTIGFRSLLKRKARDDTQTFRLWNAWIVFLYAIPLLVLAWSP